MRGLPIFDGQTGHALKLAGVVGDEGEAVGEGDGGGQDVHGADRCAGCFEVGADAGGVAGRGVVEGASGERAEEGGDFGEIGFRLSTAEGADEEFEADDGADDEF